MVRRCEQLVLQPRTWGGRRPALDGSRTRVGARFRIAAAHRTSRAARRTLRCAPVRSSGRYAGAPYSAWCDEPWRNRPQAAFVCFTSVCRGITFTSLSSLTIHADFARESKVSRYASRRQSTGRSAGTVESGPIASIPVCSRRRVRSAMRSCTSCRTGENTCRAHAACTPGHRQRGSRVGRGCCRRLTCGVPL